MGPGRGPLDSRVAEVDEEEIGRGLFHGSGEADADVLYSARLAGHLDVHRCAANLAVLDRRVVTLRGVRRRGNDLAAMRALDLDFYEHIKA